MILQRTSGPVDFESEDKDYIQVNDETYEVIQTKMDEDVNHPTHYRHGQIECIDCIASIVNMYNGEDAYLAGAIVKYLYRANNKGYYTQDLRKAQWYMNRLVKNAEQRFKDK